jgi:hypothetical protein
MADGKTYEVPHHGAAMVLQDFLRVGVDFNQAGIPARAVTCPLSEISQIEEVL